MALRLVRANAVTVNEVLDGHKLLEIDCADRVYLTWSVPSLVVGGQVVNFITEHERNPIPSPAVLDRRGQAFRRAVTSFAEANDIPVLSFAGKRDKGRPGVLADSPWPERKIDQVTPLMRQAAAPGRSRVVAIGVAQEYQRVFTGTKDQTATGAVWFSYNRTERRVTCYYFSLSMCALAIRGGPADLGIRSAGNGALGLVQVVTVRTWLEAAEVAQGVFRVRSKQVNCYLVRDGSSVTLVDSGLPGHWPAIKAACGALGLGLPAIEAVLLTHVHSDHAWQRRGGTDRGVRAHHARRG